MLKTSQKLCQDFKQNFIKYISSKFDSTIDEDIVERETERDDNIEMSTYISQITTISMQYFKCKSRAQVQLHAVPLITRENIKEFRIVRFVLYSETFYSTDN